MNHCKFIEEDFRTLVDSTRVTVLGAIRKHLDPMLVDCIDDVAQEVYLRVCRHGATFRGDPTQKRLNAWIYVIARNESFRMNVKMKKKIEILRDDLDDLIVEDATGPDTEKTENELSILKAIESLPDKHRNVIRLLMQKFSIAEIAEKLAISQGTVKSRIHRAREKLARLLDENLLEY